MVGNRITKLLLAAFAVAGIGVGAAQAASTGARHQRLHHTPAHKAKGAAGAGASTATPIRHLVVIFQENVSFDHYFGTYPHATNPPGEPAFTPHRTRRRSTGCRERC